MEIQKQPHSQFSVLPAEILNEIFSILADQNKRLLSSCALVCRLWYFVSQRFLDSSIHVRVKESKLVSLYKDLMDFPILASKISHLHLVVFSSLGEYIPECETFQVVINCCTNLIELKFDNNNVYHYLQVLNTHLTELPKIQRIQIANLSSSSPAVRRFHLWLNHRFRKSITKMEIADLGDNDALKNYGGLVELLPKFTELTQLKVKSLRDSGDSEMNLTTVLTLCPTLQEIDFYNIQRMTIDETAEEFSSINHGRLTKLKLKVRDMDIKALNTITTRFTNVDNLRIITPIIVPDRNLTSEQATTILNNFKNYAKSKKKSNICFSYNGEMTRINIGQTKRCSDAIFIIGFPDHNFIEHILMEQLAAREFDGHDHFYPGFFDQEEEIDYFDNSNWAIEDMEALRRRDESDDYDFEEEERMAREDMEFLDLEDDERDIQEIMNDANEYHEQLFDTEEEMRQAAEEYQDIDHEERHIQESIMQDEMDAQNEYYGNLYDTEEEMQQSIEEHLSQQDFTDENGDQSLGNLECLDEQAFNDKNEDNEGQYDKEEQYDEEGRDDEENYDEDKYDVPGDLSDNNNSENYEEDQSENHSDHSEYHSENDGFDAEGEEANQFDKEDNHSNEDPFKNDDPLLYHGGDVLVDVNHFDEDLFGNEFEEHYEDQQDIDYFEEQYGYQDEDEQDDGHYFFDF